jgi:hypothetical protein
VSRGADGGPANGASAAPAISGDGRFVAFQSDASNLVCARNCPAALQDVNLLWDVFVYDRSSQRISRASVERTGGWMEPSIGPALSGSGDVLAFSSRHPIDVLDRANDFDLFVRALARRKRPGQSFPEVIKQHFGSGSTGRDLLEAVKRFNLSEEMLDGVEAQIRARRRSRARIPKW